MLDQDLAAQSLDRFFGFHWGKLSLNAYAVEFDSAGLQLNEVGKFWLFFRNSGLAAKTIEDEQTTENFYGGKGDGCYTCGSKWHHAHECPMKVVSGKGKQKGKGKGKFRKGFPRYGKGYGWSYPKESQREQERAKERRKFGSTNGEKPSTST